MLFSIRASESESKLENANVEPGTGQRLRALTFYSNSFFVFLFHVPTTVEEEAYAQVRA